MLYGASWIIGLLNLLAAVVALPEGRNPLEYLSMILLPFGVILYVHHLAGWYPFHRRAR